MSGLSMFYDGRPPAVLVANLISTDPLQHLQAGAEVTFDLFEQNASVLKTLIGKTEYYVLESEPFWGSIKSLIPFKSPYADSKIARLREKPTLRGVLSIIGDSAIRQ